HTRFDCDWSSDVCSSDLDTPHRVELETARGSSLPIGRQRIDYLAEAELIRPVRIELNEPGRTLTLENEVDDELGKSPRCAELVERGTGARLKELDVWVVRIRPRSEERQHRIRNRQLPRRKRFDQRRERAPLRCAVDDVSRLLLIAANG